MPAKAFLDTNVMICAFSESEAEKCAIARRLWLLPETWIRSHIINETCNVLTRKFRLPFVEFAATVVQIVQTLPVLAIVSEVIRKALTLALGLGLLARAFRRHALALLLGRSVVGNQLLDSAQIIRGIGHVAGGGISGQCRDH